MCFDWQPSKYHQKITSKFFIDTLYNTNFAKIKFYLDGPNEEDDAAIRRFFSFFLNFFYNRFHRIIKNCALIPCVHE